MSKIEPLYQCERCKEDYPEGSCYPLSQLGHAGTKDGPILCDGCMDDYRIENDGGGDPSSWYAVRDPREERIADLERQLQEAQRWKRAVDNELVCCHLGTTDSMEPNVAIASIGRWHYDLGVSGVCEPDSTAGEPE